jgi:quinol monooxygenase YgiN
LKRSTGLSGFFKKVFSIFLLLYLLFTAAAFSLAAEKPVTKRILVIYSYHEGLPWERLINDSLRTTLASKSTEPIELNIEHTDRVSYPDDAYLHKLVNLYRHKYSHPKMDLIIAVGDEATEILLKHGEELFPQIPMVFVTAERKTLRRAFLKPNMTSLLWGVDIKGTVDLIGEILPQTRNIFFVAGTSLTDSETLKLARASFRGYTKRFAINYLTDMTKEDLIESVTDLPERSVVLFLAFFRDAEGKSFVPREIMSVISEKRKELLQTVHPLIALIREEKGCISCRLFKDDEDENSFALVEEWETQEGLDNYLRSDRFGVLLGAKSLLREPHEIKINTVSYSAGIEAVNAARGKNT